jgi:hypothetical protein
MLVHRVLGSLGVAGFGAAKIMWAVPEIRRKMLWVAAFRFSVRAMQSRLWL